MKPSKRILMLGGGEGWHADQLRQACAYFGCNVQRSDYESLSARVGTSSTVTCEAGELDTFDAVLTRTMPAATLERITFRLAVLHHLIRQGKRIVNSPASLEIAIDKYAALAKVADLGLPVPETCVVQSRADAMAAFADLGGDCVVKPLFGGEGRGVMRVNSVDLAATTFSTLDQLGAAIYLQRFIAPGGCDTRLLKIGRHITAFRRTNPTDFRTNRSHGGQSSEVDLQPWHSDLAIRVCDAIGLSYGTVDLIDDNHANDGYRIVEVNAVPGWKAAQSVCGFSIAQQIVEHVVDAV